MFGGANVKVVGKEKNLFVSRKARKVEKIRFLAAYATICCDAAIWKKANKLKSSLRRCSLSERRVKLIELILPLFFYVEAHPRKHP